METRSKVVFVAGGTGGLGRAVSLTFLEIGARVAVTYRDEAELQELRKTADRNATNLSAFAVDVTHEAAVQNAVQKLIEQQGRLDVLVNTVGAYAGGINGWELDSKTLERMLSLNLRSGFVLTKAVVPEMLRQKSGSIVNVAAKAAFDHAAGASAYAASKAAAVAFMDSLSADLKGSGVRVNTILPSIIDTAANRKFMPKADFSLWPKPEQIAKVILFLSSDDASVVHGAAIPVYGDS
jgi:NAD(P)-dependent dehydrogenase (short-subunit alcohol dehydrogenase family)